MLTEIGDKITTALAAEIIGCTDAHVRYLIKHGILDGDQFGRMWVVSRRSVEKFAKKPQVLGRPRGS